MCRITRPFLVLICSLITTADVVRAQLPFDPYDDGRDPATAIKFNLSPPGARSLAMGGAFLGFADDATAAYTNPAGLTNLALGGSEVAAEVRLTRFTTSFTDRGHYPTFPEFTQPPTLLGQDTVAGLPPGEAESETSGLSFVSYGYVLPGGLTLAVYRHELANFRGGFESQGPFNDYPSEQAFEAVMNDSPPPPPPIDSTQDFCDEDSGVGVNCDFYRVLPRRVSAELTIVNYGISAAYAFDLPPLKGLESSLSLGLGLSLYELEFDGLSQTFDLCRFEQFDPPEDFDPANDVLPGCPESRTRTGAGSPLPGSRQPGAFFGPADFSRDNLLYGTIEEGDDQAFGFSLGLLWKLGREQRWSLGGVFREGPEFETRRQFDFLGRQLSAEPFETDGGSVTVPDVFGLGVAFRNADTTTRVAFDVNRVRYSQTIVDFNVKFCTEFNEEDFSCLPNKLVTVSEFEIPDVTQVHLGFERTVLVVESLFVGTVRLGAWHEPFHEPEYRPAGRPDPDLAAVLRRSNAEDQTHVSAGFGLVIREDYQIDLALDYSDPVTTFSFSLVKFL